MHKLKIQISSESCLAVWWRNFCCDLLVGNERWKAIMSNILGTFKLTMLAKTNRYSSEWFPWASTTLSSASIATSKYLSFTALLWLSSWTPPALSEERRALLSRGIVSNEIRNSEHSSKCNGWNFECNWINFPFLGTDKKAVYFRQKKNLQRADQKYLTYDAPPRRRLDFPGWI